MMAVDRKIGKYTVHVVTPDEVGEMNITPEDQDMDRRVKAAVDSAIKKAKVCKKPIAKYDIRKKKAYLLDSDGVRKYVD